MRLKIQKWGNSLALRIPRFLAIESHIEAGSEVDISRSEDNLIIKPVRDATGIDLDDLLNGITTDNLHEEIVTGEASGNEVW